LVTSAIVEQELGDAPTHVWEFAQPIMDEAEEAFLSDEALRLHEAYLEAGIVGPRRGNDALHVALASVAGCVVIVSWNFRHIVHMEKIPLYNGVNALHGYRGVAIHSPLEVIDYGEEEV
jgi:hypothetical protein